MTFRRTISGLNNSYLFYSVDAVVYLEGGDSLTREDVENGKFNSATDDIRFWQALFGFYRPGRRYQFCSVGSKETVKSIAKDIEQGHVHNVIAAMDRDFDNINNRIVSGDNIIYTLGYSWENDAWTPEAVSEAYCMLSGSCKTGIQSVEKSITQYFEECALHIRGAVRADAVLSQNGSSLFCRDSYMRYVEIARSGYPSVNIQEIRNSLKAARVRLGKPVHRTSNFSIKASIDCFGHLFAEFAYRLLKYLLENFNRLPKVPKSYAIPMVVEKFIQLLRDGSLPELKVHYDAAFARIAP